jgi:hypothetical protein
VGLRWFLLAFPLAGEVDRSATALRSGEGVASQDSLYRHGFCEETPSPDPCSKLHGSTSPTRGVFQMFVKVTVWLTEENPVVHERWIVLQRTLNSGEILDIARAVPGGVKKFAGRGCNLDVCVHNFWLSAN